MKLHPLGAALTRSAMSWTSRIGSTWVLAAAHSADHPDASAARTLVETTGCSGLASLSEPDPGADSVRTDPVPEPGGGTLEHDASRARAAFRSPSSRPLRHRSG